MKQTLVLMVGLPASGKSTAIETLKDLYTFEVHSTDELIEQRALELGTTYNDIFSEYIGTASKQFWAQLSVALSQGKNVVVDRTNLNVKSRRQVLSLAPPECRKIAYVLNTPDPLEWRRRLDSRSGKTIPPGVLDTMQNLFTMPTHKEGFDLIWTSL